MARFGKQDIDKLEKRYESEVAALERQVQELNSQITIKNKDISNYRCETADLANRLGTRIKTKEIEIKIGSATEMIKLQEETLQELE